MFLLSSLLSLLRFDFLDVNECNINHGFDCASFSLCENSVGSYECRCIDGYGGDGIICAGRPTAALSTVIGLLRSERVSASVVFLCLSVSTV